MNMPKFGRGNYWVTFELTCERYALHYLMKLVCFYSKIIPFFFERNLQLALVEHQLWNFQLKNSLLISFIACKALPRQRNLKKMILLDCHSLLPHYFNNYSLFLITNHQQFNHNTIVTVKKSQFNNENWLGLWPVTILEKFQLVGLITFFMSNSNLNTSYVWSFPCTGGTQQATDGMEVIFK